MKPILLAQIQSLESLLPQLGRIAQAEEQNKAFRPVLTPEREAFFRPETPAAIATWVDDSVTRNEVTEAALRCPAGARVYWTDDSVGCAFPAGVGGVPVRHGLTLSFSPSGRLASQRFYEEGLLRWDISYHASGGRSSQGFYCDRERFEQRAHGLITSFSTHGTVTAQAWYFDGKRHGWSKLWEDDGFPIVGERFEHDQKIEEVLPDGTYRVVRS
ncbi:MAG: hypothetical protein U0165_11865 [Polyangiaceae bacterium]